MATESTDSSISFLSGGFVKSRIVKNLSTYAHNLENGPTNWQPVEFPVRLPSQDTVPEVTGDVVPGPEGNSIAAAQLALFNTRMPASWANSFNGGSGTGSLVTKRMELDGPLEAITPLLPFTIGTFPMPDVGTLLGITLDVGERGLSGQTMIDVLLKEKGVETAYSLLGGPRGVQVGEETPVTITRAGAISDGKATVLGTETGVVQAADSALVLKLAADASSEDGFYVGRTIEITGGPGSGNTPAVIVTYNGTTKIASLDRSWSGVTNTSVYKIQGLSRIIATEGTWNAGDVGNPIELSSSPSGQNDRSAVISQLVSDTVVDVVSSDGNPIEFLGHETGLTWTSQNTALNFNVPALSKLIVQLTDVETGDVEHLVADLSLTLVISLAGSGIEVNLPLTVGSVGSDISVGSFASVLDDAFQRLSIVGS
jgi:hypothetical protein